MSNNRTTGLTLIVLGAVVIVMTMTMTVPSTSLAEEVGPQLFPMIAGVGILICGVGIFFQKEKKKSAENDDGSDEITEINWEMMKRIIRLGIVLVLYAVALYWLGYTVSTFVALLVFTKLLAGEKKLSWIKIIFFSLIVTAAVYYIMGNIFQVILPKGALF